MGTFNKMKTSVLSIHIQTTCETSKRTSKDESKILSEKVRPTINKIS